MKTIQILLLTAGCFAFSLVGVRADILDVTTAGSVSGGPGGTYYQYDTSDLSAGPTITLVTGAPTAVYGIAFDSAGNQYSAEYTYAATDEYDSTNTYVGDTGIVPHPYGVGVNSSNDIYVSDNSGSYVAIMSPLGTVLSTFGNSSELSAASGLAFDSAGNVYVANEAWYGDPLENTVAEFTSSGTFVKLITNVNFGRTDDVAFDSAGNMYVSNLAGNSVTELDASGNFVKNITTNVNAPNGVAFDSAGDLWVANSGSGTVTEYDSAGNYLTSLSVPGASMLALESVVPEPSTYMLLGLGGLLLVAGYRSRKASSLS